MNALTFGAAALARHESKHRATDSLLFNSAGFSHDGKKYVVEVAGHVVLETTHLSRVREFSAMHNGRLADASIA